MRRTAVVITGALVLVLATALVGADLASLLGDPAGVRSAILGLGPWGPVGLIMLSAVQIVLAPVPGYLVQVAGGYLSGPWGGSAYGLIGMLVGAAAAFLAGRHVGRPLVQRLVPTRFVDGWLRLRNVDSMTAWVLILLLPVGDFCYFLAGLTAISLPKMLLATALVRGPTVVVAALVGAQVATVPPTMLWTIAAAAALLAVGLFLVRDRVAMFVFERFIMRVLGKHPERSGEQ